MSPLTSFFVANIVPVLFIHGLAFFSMGFATVLESRRTSELPIARSMSLLAAFGLVQGLRAWVDMAQVLSMRDNPSVYAWPTETLRVGLLVLSFLFLFAFGSRLLLGERQWPWGIWLFTSGAAFVWALPTYLIGFLNGLSETEWLAVGDALSRYLIAIPAALLTSWALQRQESVLRDRGMPFFGRDLVFAAVGFLFYGVVGQIFVRPTVVFPSTYINTGLFIYVFGMPVQVFRAGMAVVIATTVIRALRAFDVESRQQLAAANEARLLAQGRMLEEQRKRQQETSLLNRELQVAARELTVLYDLSRLLASTLELDTLLREAVSRIANSVEPVRAASIWLTDESAGDVVLMACEGCDDEPANEQQANRVANDESRRNVVIAAMNTGCAMGLYPTGAIAPVIGESPVRVGPDGRRREMWPQGVAVPLMRQGRPVGSLLLEARSSEPGITSDDLPMVGAMAVPLSLAVENALLYSDLKQREAIRGELLHRVVSAQEAERRRVARELHDDTGQSLTALALGLKGTAETIRRNPSLAAKQLEELRHETGQALDALRRLVSDLRPAQLDDLGLIAALRWYVDDYGGRVPLRATMQVFGKARRLDPVVESVLFRIAQEALTNVAKHSGAATVRVELDFRPVAVRLTIIDDGIGFNPDQALHPTASRKSYGLLGMKERADLVNAKLMVTSAPSRGTQVSVEVATGEVAQESGALEDETSQTAAGR